MATATTYQEQLIFDHLGSLDIEPDDTVKVFEAGRVSVLRDFDNLCQADGFVGYTEDEWATIKRFFAMNKASNQWDKV